MIRFYFRIFDFTVSFSITMPTIGTSVLIHKVLLFYFLLIVRVFPTAAAIRTCYLTCTVTISTLFICVSRIFTTAFANRTNFSSGSSTNSTSCHCCYTSFIKLYHFGIFLLYHSGIILSRGETDEIKRITQTKKNFSSKIIY